MVTTVLEQFFDEIKTYDDGTKSVKYLLCHNDQKKSGNGKKQPTIQQSFGQRGTQSSNNTA